MSDCEYVHRTSSVIDEKSEVASKRLRRSSLPLSLGALSRTSRDSSEGSKSIQVSYRTKTTCSGFFIKKIKEEHEGTFQR